MTNRYHLFFLSILILCISCEKEAKLDTETQSSIDYSIVEPLFTNVLMLTDQVLLKSQNIDNSSISNTSCANVTVLHSNPNDTSVFPKTIVFDFDSTGCFYRKKLTKGIFKVQINADYGTQDNQMNISFENYQVNNINISGNIIINSPEASKYGFTVVSGEISFDSKKITYNAVKELILINTGLEANNYRLNGKANGVNSEGLSFEAEITQTIEKSLNCNFNKKGIVKVKPDELVERFLNFGEGDCNSNAIITINGYNYTFDLN